MSLSLVTGTDVPETANGVVTPVPTENGTVPVICGGSRVPCSGDSPSTGTLIDTDNHIHIKNRVPDGDGHSEMCNSGKMCGLAGASLPAATRTECSRDTDVPEDSDVALSGDSEHCQGFGRQEDSAMAYGEQMEAETVHGDPNSRDEDEEEGEKEKQDEEEDEKKEKKWIHQHSGGRVEGKVSGLNYFQLLLH